MKTKYSILLSCFLLGSSVAAFASEAYTPEEIPTSGKLKKEEKQFNEKIKNEPNAKTLKNTLIDGWKIDARLYSKTDVYTGKNTNTDFSELYFDVNVGKKLNENFGFNAEVDYRDYYYWNRTGGKKGSLFSIDDGMAQFVESDFTLRQLNLDFRNDDWYVVAGSRAGKQDLINNDAHTSTGLTAQYTFAKDLKVKAIGYSSVSSDESYEGYSRNHYTHGRSLYGATVSYKNKKSWYEAAAYEMGNDGSFNNTHNAGMQQNFTGLSNATFENKPTGYYANAKQAFPFGLVVQAQYFSLDWDLDKSSDKLGGPGASGVDVFSNSYMDNKKTQTKAVIQLIQKTKYGNFFAGFSKNGDRGGVVSFTNGLGTYAANDNNIILPAWKSLWANYRAATTTTWAGIKTPTFFGRTFANIRYIDYDTDLNQLKQNGYNTLKDVEDSEAVVMVVTKLAKGLMLKTGYSGIKYYKDTIASGTNDRQNVYRVMFDYRF